MEIMESCVPPGFRFHPTEEELVGYYLNKKVNSVKIDLDVIIDIDLYKMEPWEIQDSCKLGYEEQTEWYFFSHKDRKYPTGTRTNRATNTGFWKATGRDKAVLSKDKIIGMRKTLVFYKGRAPNGRKTDWIMHEYRLQTTEHGPPQEEGWVVCRAFKKPSPSHRQGYEPWNNAYCAGNYRPPSYPKASSLTTIQNHQETSVNNLPFAENNNNNNQIMIDLPKLDSPSISTSFGVSASLAGDEMEDEKSNVLISDHQFSDWKSFEKLLGSQMSSGPSSYTYASMPLVSNYYDEFDADQSHSSVDLFESFPDL